MARASMTLDQLSPQDGDVVVTRVVHSRVHYTVRQLPGVVQFRAAVRDEAVRLARAFAEKHVVDVWFSEAGKRQLLEARRPTTLLGRRVRPTDEMASMD